MPADSPNALEILEAVQEYLTDRVVPALSGHTAFEARIAANLLRVARRELEQAPTDREAERTRLQELLGSEGALDDLEAQLIERIRLATLGDQDPALRAHLRATAEERLRVANPKYLVSDS